MNAMTQAAPEVFCDCGAPAEYVTGAVMYPHRRDLHHKSFYRSVPCDARVGCHPGTKAPLGRLATRRVRVARQRAHAAFDPLWKQGRMTRGDAYAWLAEQLGISRQDCHIGHFDEETRNRAVAAVRALGMNGQGAR